MTLNNNLKNRKIVNKKTTKMMRKGRETYHQVFAETKRILRDIEIVRERIQKLSEENFDAFYGELSKQLSNLKEELEIHRELGGEFEIVQGNKRKLMEITSDGQIIISTITIGTKHEIPTHTSKLAYFRMELKDVPEGEENLFYFFQSEQIYYIENIKTIRRVDDRTLKIVWVNIKKKKSKFESEECDELEGIFGAKLRKFNKSKIQQINILKELWKELITEYDCNNAEHETLLLQFWNKIYPDKPLSDRITKEWSALGFQGKNPATDFRGGGILSLKNLLYISTHYTDQVKSIINRNAEYPFASAGINVTLLIFNVFLNLNSGTINLPVSDRVWNSDLLTLFTYSNSLNAFDEFYFMFLCLLDAMWIKMNAGYMDFPNVMKQTIHQMSILLSRRALSIEQFKSLLNQTILLLGE